MKKEYLTKVLYNCTFCWQLKTLLLFFKPNRKVITFLLGLLVLGVTYAQKPSIKLDQAGNDSYASPDSPMDWQNGNLNPNQAHYIEGHSVPYRALMTNMPTDGTEVTLTLGYDLINNSLYALDFITNYDWLVPHDFENHTITESINPIAPTSYSPPEDELPINLPDYLEAMNDGYQGVINARNEFYSLEAQGKAKIAIWGADFNQGYGVTYTFNESNSPITAMQVLDLTRGETKVEFTVKFTPTESTVVMAWGGHIALRQDWGISPIRSAGGISGSPYHMRTINWSLGNLGNQDRSLQVALSAPICPSDFPDNPQQLCTDEVGNPIDCPESVCAPSTQYFGVPIESGATSYLWQFIENSAGATLNGNPTDQNISVTPTTSGSYTIQVELRNDSGIVTTCEETINVIEIECDIAGDLEVCPNSTNNVYSAPEGYTSYQWSILGNGTINGLSTNQTVSVDATDCGEFTLSLTITNEAGCESSCEYVVAVSDIEPPVIVDLDDYKLDECNQDWPEEILTTWTDNCATGATILAVAGEITDNGCTQSRVYTFTATDDCDNTTIETVTITRDYDETPPVLVYNGETMLDGCNAPWPESIPIDWTDNCGIGGMTSGVAQTTSVGDVVDGDCSQSRIYSFSVTDDCGNPQSIDVTISREYDETPPIILDVDDYTICNDLFPETLVRTWTDNCSLGGEITAVVGEIINRDECTQTRDYTFTVTDDCLNTTTEVITITREIDKYEYCETAFARMNNESQCFIQDGFNRWGWTNMISPENSYSMPLYTGAGLCDISKGNLVGSVEVAYYNGNIEVEYVMYNNYVMSEAHVYIGCDPYPTNKKGVETVAPGQYTFNAGELNSSTGITTTFNNVEGNVYIIAHAVTCEEVCRCSERPGPDDGKAYEMNLDINCENNEEKVSEVVETKSDFEAYPVPFEDNLTVEYKFEYETDVKIYVHDIRGQLLLEKTNTNYSKGTNGRSILDLSRVADQSLIITVISNREKISKQVVSKSKKRRN